MRHATPRLSEHPFDEPGGSFVLSGCSFSTIPASDLPEGHDFVLLLRPGEQPACFTGPSGAAQAAGREAAAQWFAD